MNAYASSGDYSRTNFSRGVEQFIAGARAELQNAVDYMDAVIVPEVRRESSVALYSLAGQIEKLARTLDPNQPTKNPPMNEQVNDRV